MARWRVLSIHSVRAAPPPAGDAKTQKKGKQKRRGTQTHTLDQATSAADVSPALRMNAGPAGQGPPLRKTHTSMPAAQRHTENCKRGTPIDAARVSRLASRRASRVASCKPCLHHVRVPHLPHARPLVLARISTAGGVLSMATASSRHTAVATVAPASSVLPPIVHNNEGASTQTLPCQKKKRPLSPAWSSGRLHTWQGPLPCVLQVQCPRTRRLRIVCETVWCVNALQQKHKCVPVAFAEVSARLSNCLDSEQRGSPGCLVPHPAALRS